MAEPTPSIMSSPAHDDPEAWARETLRALARDEGTAFNGAIAGLHDLDEAQLILVLPILGRATPSLAKPLVDTTTALLAFRLKNAVTKHMSDLDASNRVLAKIGVTLGRVGAVLALLEVYAAFWGK